MKFTAAALFACAFAYAQAQETLDYEEAALALDEGFTVEETKVKM